jgi:hypothetical protein
LLSGIDFSSDDTYRTSTLMSEDAFRSLGGEPVALVSTDESRVDVNCFADEVVIDFPSVALAVDRIRRGFLVDEPPPRWHAARVGQRSAPWRDGAPRSAGSIDVPPMRWAGRVVDGMLFTL